MEAAQARVQSEVTNSLNTLDKEHLRKLQAVMFRCSTKCCENDNYNMEEVQRCLDGCSQPVQKAQHYLQGEIENFQSRLQRCAMDCQDQIRDKVGPKTSENEKVKFRTHMESCVLKCADTHIGLLPQLMKRVKESLKDYHH